MSEHQAQDLGAAPPEKAAAPREKVSGYTIDAVQSRDLDDGIWVKAREEGGWRAWVTIASPGALVEPGSKLDMQARERVATVYRISASRSMLPIGLVDRRLSLNPGAPRHSFTMRFDIEANGEISARAFYPSRFLNKARLTHDQVPDLLTEAAGASPSPLATSLRDAAQLAGVLLSARRARGALALYDLNNGWVATEEGHVKHIDQRKATMGYVIVQELMILANGELARFGVEQEIPLLFRNHRARASAPDRAWLMEAFATAVSVPFLGLSRLQEQTHLALDRARYGVTSEGHYGLNLPAYIHATSPIRRYADLVNLRQVIAHVTGEPMPHTREDLAAIATHINEALEQMRAEEAVRHRVVAEGRANRAVDAQRVADVGPALFERVVKLATRSGEPCPEHLADGLLMRLARKDLPLLPMALLLTAPAAPEAGWGRVHTGILEELSTIPAHAMSIVEILQAAGLWPKVTFEVAPRMDGAPTPLFEASAAVDLPGGRVAMTTRAPSILGAKHKAAFGLLARSLGRDLEPAVPAVELSRTEPAVSALTSYCQALGLPPPAFSFSQTGEPHKPVFTCVCVAVGAEGSAEARQKKLAKEQAAEAVRAMLLARKEGA